MAKDRLDDTCEYLKRQIALGQLGTLANRDIDDFKRYATNNDRLQGGDALSLNWSWYNTRPSEDDRHAIRGYLLASIYNRDINASDAGTEANRVKNFGAQWLHREIAARLGQYLGLSDAINTKAVRYQVGSKGADDKRADAVCDRLFFSVEDELEIAHLSDRNIAVVLIDMQATGDVGQTRLYGGRSVLEHQRRVLKVAASMQLIVYDIVIDPAYAAQIGTSTTIAQMSPEEKSGLVERQRRDSYATKAPIKTISVLRDLYGGGARVRHIPKPSHPSFIGTLFGEHLEADGIDTVVVMGYDANQCVKATVFGAPGSERMTATHAPTDREVTELQRWEPGLSAQAALDRLRAPKMVKSPYTPGLLDRDIDVITSRAVMASSFAPLDPEWAMLAGLR